MKTNDDIQIRTTRPSRYTVKYADGPRTYEERFAVMRVPPDLVREAGGGVDDAIDAIAEQMSAEGGDLGKVGAFLVRVAAHLIKHANLDSNGGLTLYFAYHYYGTKARGIDLTAWPVPGVDPKAWHTMVNGLLAAGSRPGAEEGDDAAVKVPAGASPDGKPKKAA